MRNTFVSFIRDSIKDDQRVILLSGDMGNELFNDITTDYPSNFLNCGISEAGMVGMAAGLAIKGLRPYIYSISPFVTLRVIEQIRIDLCYQNLPVKIIGLGAGLSYAKLGPTHHALEDLAMTRCLPNIEILTPSGPSQLRGHLEYSLGSDSPCYIRIGKSGEKDLYTSEVPIYPGNFFEIIKGNDVLILGIGPILKNAVKAAEMLNEHHVSCAVVDINSLIPIDKKGLDRLISRKYKAWFVLEEHSVAGGVYSFLAEYIILNSLHHHIDAMHSLSVPQHFLHSLGDTDFMHAQLKLDSENIVISILKLLS